MASVPSDIFERLESGDKQIVENIKQNLREQFGRGMKTFWFNLKIVYYQCFLIVVFILLQ